MMRRKAYDEMMKWKADHRTALLLRGPRQTGKTYLMKQFSEEYDSSLYINIEDEPAMRKVFENSRNPDEIYKALSILKGFSVPKGGPKPLLILDEVQSSEASFSALKPLAEDGRCDIIASGSLLGVLLNDKLLSPMGYVKPIYIGPMDFEEFLWALGTDEKTTSGIRKMISDGQMPESVRTSAESIFSKYMIVGGMPAAVSAYVEMGDYNEVWARHNEIMEFARGDVMRYAPNALKIKILAALDSIPRILAKEHKVFKYSEIEHRQGYGSREYDSSLEWLVAAGLAIRCRNLSQTKEPLAENEKNNSFKLYMHDTGLLMYAYGRETVSAIASGDIYVNKGAAVENITAQSLLSSGFRLYFYSKEDSRRELDFVIKYKDKVTGLEVKSGRKKHSKSLLMSLKDGSIDAGIKIADFKAEVDENGVQHLPLFSPAFMESRTEIELDLPDVSALNRMVEENR
ncbi:ATPase AAA+ superfamily [methanogenic archaeon mixed culture ISO4-G1]|nr:ATPase AAA+ superfamily [methanogenic archaeon mixed culture ISO4-G1]